MKTILFRHAINFRKKQLKVTGVGIRQIVFLCSVFNYMHELTLTKYKSSLKKITSNLQVKIVRP